jgi:flagellar motor switch protein FliN/FliY
VTTKTAPFTILQRLSPELFALDETPLIDCRIPLDELAEQLVSRLGLESASLEVATPIWLAPPELSTGMGSPLQETHLQLSGLKGDLTLLATEQDIDALIRLLLKTDSHSQYGEEISFGLYRFFQLEAMQAVQELAQKHHSPLLPRLTHRQEPLKTPNLSIDIRALLDGKKLFARLLLSQELVESLRQSQYGKAFPSKIDALTEMSCHLEIGSVDLSLTELNQLAIGDFLLLDRNSYSPQEEKTRLLLTLFGVPFFRARLKGDKLKILEFPFYQEDQSMGSNYQKFTPADAHDGHEELENEEDHDKLELDEDHDELELDEDSAFEEDSEEAEAAPATQPDQQEQKIHALKEIPVHVVIEAGRIKIPLKKLLELQPGNVLEMNVRPEEGVDLVVNGQKIGRGEFLLIGEKVGVRILQMGEPLSLAQED